MSVGSLTTAFFSPASAIVCEIVVVSSTGLARSLVSWRILALNFGWKGSAPQLSVLNVVDPDAVWPS